ncbi:Hypothetical predicted protein, partial [Paramuricea clavata]
SCYLRYKVTDTIVCAVHRMVVSVLCKDVLSLLIILDFFKRTDKEFVRAMGSPVSATNTCHTTLITQNQNNSKEPIKRILNKGKSALAEHVTSSLGMTDYFPKEKIVLARHAVNPMPHSKHIESVQETDNEESEVSEDDREMQEDQEDNDIQNIQQDEYDTDSDPEAESETPDRDDVDDDLIFMMGITTRSGRAVQ